MPGTDLVGLIKVNKFLTYSKIGNENVPVSMEVEIIKNYGGLEKRSVITVWGDNGRSCRPYLSEFTPGEYYVMALYEESPAGSGDKQEYYVSNCGEFWLYADPESGMVSGKMTGTTSFERLKKNLLVGEDRTRFMTSEDFRQIFQLAIDLPELQQYYHTENEENKQLYFIDFGNANHNGLKEVAKFGLPVKMVSEEYIKAEKIEKYFNLGHWVCGLHAASIQLEYIGEGIMVGYRFERHNGIWKITNSSIIEE